MIILISGTGHSGKTLMAQRLLEKYKTPYLSVDHLKMGIYRSDENCGFTPMDNEDVIGEKLWPIIREMVKTNIENNQNLIIEGCYILPHHLQSFEKSYVDKVIPIFIVFSPQYIRNHFEAGILKYRNVVESRQELDESDYDIEEFIRDHDNYRRRCVEAGLLYFEIHEDYEREIEAAYIYIEKRLMALK